MTRIILRAALAGIFLLSLSACAKRSYPIARANDQHSQTVANTLRININTASAKQLEDLPGIGKGLAERIIQHREKYGPFRRAEHLIIVRGISDRRFRALRDFVTVD
ncbi:MAG TPA: ComEA family DNA-binding protein [Pyrinomonadaceae bacterium]